MIFGPSAIYHHAIDGGTIPEATWQQGSMVSITGTASVYPLGINGQQFYDMTWNSTVGNPTIGLNSNFTVSGTLNFIDFGAGGNAGRLSKGGLTSAYNICANNVYVAPDVRIVHDNDANSHTRFHISGNFTYIGTTPWRKHSFQVSKRQW